MTQVSDHDTYTYNSCQIVVFGRDDVGFRGVSDYLNCSLPSPAVQVLERQLQVVKRQLCCCQLATVSIDEIIYYPAVYVLCGRGSEPDCDGFDDVKDYCCPWLVERTSMFQCRLDLQSERRFHSGNSPDGSQLYLMLLKVLGVMI